MKARIWQIWPAVDATKSKYFLLLYHYNQWHNNKELFDGTLRKRTGLDLNNFRFSYGYNTFLEDTLLTSSLSESQPVLQITNHLFDILNGWRILEDHKIIRWWSLASSDINCTKGQFRLKLTWQVGLKEAAPVNVQSSRYSRYPPGEY